MAETDKETYVSLLAACFLCSADGILMDSVSSGLRQNQAGKVVLSEVGESATNVQAVLWAHCKLTGASLEVWKTLEDICILE
jgi:hypothetical protein